MNKYLYQQFDGDKIIGSTTITAESMDDAFGLAYKSLEKGDAVSHFASDNNDIKYEFNSGYGKYRNVITFANLINPEYPVVEIDTAEEIEDESTVIRGELPYAQIVPIDSIVIEGTIKRDKKPLAIYKIERKR